jgi:hypothetical protein
LLVEPPVASKPLQFEEKTMKIAKYLGFVATMSMATAPAIAAPANPASSLSVAKSVRASSPSANANKLHGAGVAIAAVAGVAAIVGIVLLVDDNKSKSK